MPLTCHHRVRFQYWLFRDRPLCIFLIHKKIINKLLIKLNVNLRVLKDNIDLPVEY